MIKSDISGFIRHSADFDNTLKEIYSEIFISALNFD